jgi:LmbE family N-acetylglucosaminyl deacetylase
MLSSPAMTHVFVAPHPDDAALSCGGLIASLRESGQNVTILTVFSGGPGASADLTEYQRVALGFGTKAIWPAYETFRRSNIPADVDLVAAGGTPPWMADAERVALTQERANTQARQFWQRAAWTRSANITNEEWDERPLADAVPGQGSFEEIDFEGADAMAIRKAEEERYVYMMEASVVFLDLPDAVFRGYQGDAELLGRVRDDDVDPYDVLRREIFRLEPQAVYFPLAVGGHVDHQLCRDVGLAMLGEGRRWVMPEPDLVNRVSFYEDFPYAWWSDFEGPHEWPTGSIELPVGVDLQARYSDITEVMERKAAGIRLYGSQIQRLFESDQGMLDDLAGYHARVAMTGGVEGFAERYWAAVRP